MDLILLPGSSVHNKEWIEKVEVALRPYFESTKMQSYRHWAEGGDNDVDQEINALTNIAVSLKDYAIFAKSLGVVLAVKALKEGRIKPRKSVFLGTPISWAAEKQYIELFRNYNVPTLFIQEESDPYASYKELAAFLEESHVQNYQTAQIPGNDHDYKDIGKIKLLVHDFIK